VPRLLSGVGSMEVFYSPGGGEDVPRSFHASNFREVEVIRELA
jgi:hypothetical protein